MPIIQRKPITAVCVTRDKKTVQQERETLQWNELPSWQQDNHYIYTGYRRELGSLRKCIASLCYLHNQTVNIFSHLLGAILFVYLGLRILFIMRHETADIVVLSCFFIGVVVCLSISSTYHTILDHSEPVSRLGNKFDYVGIVFLIVGSFIPSIFYAFSCHPAWQKFYWTMISSLGLACVTVSLHDRFRSPGWRPFRAGIFVSMGLSAIFPVLHGLHLFGLQRMRDQIGLDSLVLQGLLYILGASIYAARWPERIYPGSFDIWGSSHQVFHILVVSAAVCHLNGLLIAVTYHHESGSSKCS